MSVLRFLTITVAATDTAMNSARTSNKDWNSGMVDDGDGDAVAEEVDVGVGVVDEDVTVNCVCVVLLVDASVTVNP